MKAIVNLELNVNVVLSQEELDLLKKEGVSFILDRIFRQNEVQLMDYSIDDIELCDPGIDTAEYLRSKALNKAVFKEREPTMEEIQNNDEELFSI